MVVGSWFWFAPESEKEHNKEIKLEIALLFVRIL